MGSFNQYPHVFQPLKVGNMTIKNRIQYAPMVCRLTSWVTGEVTPDYLEFLSAQARTGVGIVTIGSTSVDDETGTDFLGELSITSDDKLCGMVRIAEEVHRYGAKLSIELCHAGRGADPKLLKTPYALAPTALRAPLRSRYIKEMDQKDIDHIINDYVECTNRCLEAGFDMVLIHAAHGNLIGQFLSPYSNKRNDYYGGSFENRTRFALEVLQAVRAKVGSKINLEMRISGDELIEGGQRIDEVLEFLKIAQKYIDIVHISQGLIVDRNYSFYVMPPYYHLHCHNVKYAEAAKKVLDIPVTTVGSIMTIQEAEDILAAGKADVVAMARQLLADHDTIKKAYRGEAEKTRPCLRCGEGCGSRYGIGCHVNPIAGRESKYKDIMPARKKKKVVVVGGGPAGMMAAQTLMEKGHDVVVFEKRNRLGGLMKEISNLPFKSDLHRYVEWDIRTTMECGAKIMLNTEATPDLIKAENPDAIFIAVGSSPIIPPITGIDGVNVKHVLEVDNGKVEVGQKIVVCGGGSSGLECALALAMEGKNVTVIDMIPEEDFAQDMFFNTRNMLLHLLRSHNVKLIGSSKVEEFTARGVIVIDHNWVRSTIEADTIVIAFGMKPNLETVEAFAALVPETYIIGDCSEVKNIGNANRMGFDYAVEV